MAKISYINGSFVNHLHAATHIEDRGYQFADGIYEVIAFYNRKFIDEDLHIKRLFRSLKELDIDAPMSEKALKIIMRELIAKNNRDNGTIYMQISRGIAKRDHAFPKNTRPSIVMSITGTKSPKPQEVKAGVKVITQPDLRWARRDIKSIGLLPNVLAKQAANEAKAREAWLIGSNGNITEGAVSNAFIVSKKGEIITHPVNNNILSGITRLVVLELARKNGFKVIERAFNLKEAKEASEAFLTSTTSNVLPIVSIEGKKIGTGKPAEVSIKLLELYYKHIKQQTGFVYEV